MQRPSPEELQKHAGFLRALAFRLVGEDARADDLVQDAYVAALERPPRGSMRAWLGAVVRNLAGKIRRSEERRDRREHAAARPEPMPGADEVAARIALHRSLVQAVDALEEPYRSTIVLRFFYDLAPAEAAARLGVPVETVRTRTRRALELLRGRMDRGALLLALLPLPTRRPSTLSWGILMATKRRVVFALLLLLLVTGGMLTLARRDAAEPARAPDVQDRSPAGSAVPPGAEEADAALAGGVVETDVVLLRGLVLLDGAPVEGARVALRERPPQPPLFDSTTQLFRHLTAPLPKALDETRTDSAGRFTLRSSRRAAFTIEAVADGAIAASVLAYVPLTEDVTIRLARGETLGRVVDEAGAPVPRALVRWRSWIGSATVRGETATDAEGRFRIPGGSVWIHVSAAGYAPATAEAEGASGIVLRRGGVVTGVVRDAGKTLADATVLLVAGSVPGETRTDASGRYAMRLPERHVVHAMVHAPGRPAFGSWTGQLMLPPRPVAADRELTFDIMLPAATRLRGTVAEDEGPVEDAAVTLCRLGSLWPVAVAQARSDARGAFVFDGVPSGAYEVRAAAGCLFGKAGATVPEGGEPPAVVVSVTKGGRVEGTVAGELRVEEVGLEGGDAPGGFFDQAMRQADVDALGRFVFERVEPAEGLRVRGWSAYVRSEPFAVAANETTRVTLDTSAARMLRGRVVDARGGPVAGALVAALEPPAEEVGNIATLRTIAVTTAPDGRFAIPAPEREFAVVAYHEDAALWRSGSVDPSADLEIVLQPGLAVSGRVVWPGGAPVRDVELRVADGTSRGIGDRSWQKFPSGQFELRARSAGTVLIEVKHPDGVAPMVSFDAGTRDAVIELRRTLSIRGAVIDARGRAVSAARVTAKARGKKDAVAHSTQQGRFEIRGLEDGTYELHLEPGAQSDWYPPTLMPFVPMVVAAVAAGTGDVVVQVETGRDVKGVVLGPDGLPVANAFVVALGRPRVLPPTARTGADGRFRLTGLTVEHDEVLICVRDLPPHAVTLADEMQIRLGAGERIRLLFLAPDGKPVADQWVNASATTPAIVERVKAWRARLGEVQLPVWLEGAGAQTDADGRAEIRGVAPGEYCVDSLAAAGGVSPPALVHTGEPERTVQLEIACSISGQVVDRDGKPLGSVKGEYWINLGAYRGDAQLGYTVVGEDGTFAFDSLTAGPVRLKVGYSGPAPGYEGEAAANAPAQDVQVVATRR